MSTIRFKEGKMDDPLKFASVTEYNILICTVGILILSECVIMFMTSRGKHSTRKQSDRGTVWLVMIGWWCSAMAGAFFRSQSVPEAIRGWLLPHLSYYIGVPLIIVGVIIRCTAVITLKKAFTLSVQTTNEQNLIKTGLYYVIRNPAYTGSIISLLGVAFAYCHILGVIAVIIICFVCYGIRINIEEKALKAQFKEEFEQYCNQTKYRLIPRIY